MATTRWLRRFGYLEFLRTYGPHFTMNRMLSFDSVGCGWSASSR
jgi:tyrosyl-tRNA synthetase